MILYGKKCISRGYVEFTLVLIKFTDNKYKIFDPYKFGTVGISSVAYILLARINTKYDWSLQNDTGFYTLFIAYPYIVFTTIRQLHTLLRISSNVILYDVITEWMALRVQKWSNTVPVSVVRNAAWIELDLAI